MNAIDQATIFQQWDQVTVRFKTAEGENMESDTLNAFHDGQRLADGSWGVSGCTIRRAYPPCKFGQLLDVVTPREFESTIWSRFAELTGRRPLLDRADLAALETCADLAASPAHDRLRAIVDRASGA